MKPRCVLEFAVRQARFGGLSIEKVLRTALHRLNPKKRSWLRQERFFKAFVIQNFITVCIRFQGIGFSQIIITNQTYQLI